MLKENLFGVIGNLWSAKNDYRIRKCFAQHFSKNSNGIYVPDIAGKADDIRFFGSDSFKNFFDRFVYGSFDDLAKMFFFAIGFYSGKKAPGSKRGMNIF